MVLRFSRKPRRPEIAIPEITIPEIRLPAIEIPEIELPKLERDDVVPVLRRAAMYAIPAILTFAFFTVIAWAIRKQLTLPDEILIEPVEPVEPAYEVSA